MGKRLTNKDQLTCVKKTQISIDQQVSLVQGIVGNMMQPICIQRNATITVPGKINKLVNQTMCLMEQAIHHNWPVGIVVNRFLVGPKLKVLPIILFNINSYNMWIRQPL